MPAMSSVVCAATLIEARNLRAGFDGSGADIDVRRIGVGRRNARRAARTDVIRAAPAVAVAGVAGALSPDLAPGDIVVASEIVRADQDGSADPAVRCPSAPLLAAQLRRSGLTVHTGRVATADRVVTGAERAALRQRTGALAVDMESAWVLETLDGVATACVRVVADPATSPLLRPATVGHLRAAARHLATLGPALSAWGRAAAARRVLLASPRSFCAGVERAIDVVEEVLEQRGAPIYVRKQIVHNVHVVRRLEERGAVFVDELDEVPDGATVVFSAHGVSPAVQDEARDRGLAVIDATCPLVTKVHTEARRFADRGDTVLFIGHAGHEETEGTMGERPDSTVLVEDIEDAQRVTVSDPAKVSYLVQTTLAVDEVQEIVGTLHDRFPELHAPPSDDICYATTNRQHALRAVARDADLVLVIGSRNSSNSNRLVEIARRMGTSAYLIDDASEIELDWLDGASSIAITAGASAPTALVDEVVEVLRGLGPVTVEEHEVTQEHIRFTLPKEVRRT